METHCALSKETQEKIPDKLSTEAKCLPHCMSGWDLLLNPAEERTEAKALCPPHCRSGWDLLLNPAEDRTGGGSRSAWVPEFAGTLGPQCQSDTEVYHHHLKADSGLSRPPKLQAQWNWDFFLPLQVIALKISRAVLAVTISQGGNFYKGCGVQNATKG